MQMGARREDIDLWLVVEDPSGARAYINNFDWNLPPELRPTQFLMDDGRAIDFKTMTDEDACHIARRILREVEVPMVEREKKLIAWEQ